MTSFMTTPAWFVCAPILGRLKQQQNDDVKLDIEAAR